MLIIRTQNSTCNCKVVGLENEQSLHHFITESPWEAKDLEQQRLEIILRVLSGNHLDY